MFGKYGKITIAIRMNAPSVEANRSSADMLKILISRLRRFTVAPVSIGQIGITKRCTDSTAIAPSWISSPGVIDCRTKGSSVRPLMRVSFWN